MEKIILAVGSKRGPKLHAVSEALEAFSSILAPDTQFEVVGVEVESGVSHTPASREELMRGARQRAEALVQLARQNGAAWQYFVGLEGGLDVVQEGASAEEMRWRATLKQYGRRRVFLESWAFVTDGVRGHYGRSGGIELPEALAREVLENGVELSAAIDKFAGAVGIRDAQGAWGHFTRNAVTRQDATRLSVIAAFAPFLSADIYNQGLFRSQSMGSGL